MKKLKSVGQYFVALALAVVVFSGSVTTAHAAGGYSVIKPTPSSIAYDVWHSWCERIGYNILNVDPRSGHLQYTVLVSYEGLSNIVTDAHSAALNVTLYYNATMNRYVAYVDDASSFAFASTYGALGTTDGYVLTAQPPVSLDDTNSLLNSIRLFTTNIFDQVSAFRQKFIEYTNVAVQEYSYINTALHAIVGQLENLIASGSSTSSIISKIEEVVVAIENLSVVGGGGDVSLDFTNINVKLDELFASLEVTINGVADRSAILSKLDEVSASIRSTIIDATDDSRIISKLSSILQQFQKGGYVIESGHYVRTTLYDYIVGIYEKMGSGSGTGGGGVVDASTIVDSIKSFQYDFDDTFSDLKQIYPVEKVDTISSGAAFDWASIDMINSVTPSVPGASASVYRLPDNLSVNVEENDGAFNLSNGGRLPDGLSYKVDGVWEYVQLYGGDEIKTVTGTDIIITDASGDLPLSFEVFGKSIQNGTPSPENPVPVEGQWLNGLPYVNITRSNADGNIYSYGHEFSTGGTPFGHGIPVSSGGNYTDESGQQWLCDVVDWCYDVPGSTYYGKYTKNIGVLTYDGSSDEEWFANQFTNYCYYVYALPDSELIEPDSALCSSFVNIGEHPTEKVGFTFSRMNTGQFLFFSFGHSDYTIDEFRAYLAAHPVTVYYPLVEPEVYYSAYSYNEPSLNGVYNHITADYGSRMRISYATKSPYTALYSDTDGNWYKQRDDGSSVQITDGRVDTLNAAFNYKEYDNAADIKFNAGTNIIDVSDGELTIDYIKGSKFFNWLYLYLTNFNQPAAGSVGLGDVLDRMDTIIELLSGSVGVGSCEHTYTAEVNQEASCALPGLQTFTCSNCGSTYSEIIPSTGHDWQCTDHVEDELDPETGEVLTAGYDVFTCSICQETYNDYDGSGAPAIQSDTVAGIISRVFEKLGTVIGDLIAMVIRMLDKLLTGFDDLVTDFNTKTEQIVSFGGDYPMWLAGVWAIIPEDLMLALGFCVVVAILGILGKKLVFS